MRKFIYPIVMSVVLAACSDQDNRNLMPVEEPLKNEVKMNFIETDEASKNYGHRKDLSRVECQYDKQTGDFQLVAYLYENSDESLRISEMMQITDYGINIGSSGILKPLVGDLVPSFIFLSDQGSIKYTETSQCSTYYDINEEELRGNVVCSGLDSEINEESFIAVSFQCTNQNYLQFEIRPEML